MCDVPSVRKQMFIRLNLAIGSACDEPCPLLERDNMQLLSMKALQGFKLTMTPICGCCIYRSCQDKCNLMRILYSNSASKDLDPKAMELSLLPLFRMHFSEPL